MSYILDALKKADADRERETAAVPDLHAQGDAALGARSPAHHAGWLLAISVAAVALALLAWRWFSATPEDSKPAPTVAQAPAPPSLPSAQPLPAPAALPTPAAIARPAQTPAAPPARPRAPVAVNPAPRPAPAPAPASTSPTPLAASKATAPAPTASAARLPTLAELPADVRSQMPALAVGGSVFSPKASSRIVILNGQVFREGDKPVDGLTVEEIGLKATVLAFRGQRFELRH
jgi:general secretion pathway protein B